MSFKKFSLAQNAPGKDSPVDKPGQASPTKQPTVQPDQKPAETAPAPKS